MNATFNSPTKSIIDIQVKRREHVSQSGFMDLYTQSAITPIKEEVAPGTPRIPSVMELVYDIYDTQREIIASIAPKRFKCKIPVPVNTIEGIYKISPGLVRFDGMTHAQASEHYGKQAWEAGLRNDFAIPFIYAKEILVNSHAFTDGPAFKFEIINNMRYMTLSLQREFSWLSSRRQILSNLSYVLNQKYNCNLHVAFDEMSRVFERTGQTVQHNRDLFTTACEFYMRPSAMLSLHNFLRCQVAALRKYSDQEINVLVQRDDEVMSIEPKLAYEIQQALSIYNGRIQQWVGDFSHEPIAEF